MAAYRVNAIASVALALLMIVTLMTGCEMGGPGVAQTQPANETTDVATVPAAVTIIFDENMIKAATEQAISITPTVGTRPPIYTWADARTLKITYPQNFQPNTEYTIRVETAAKNERNVKLAKPVIFTFRTGPAAPGEVVSNK